jgi:hypothetical protein
MENKKLTPHFFFLSIGVLVTLITSVVSLLKLVFSTLDRVLPDVLTASYQYGYPSYSYEDMRSALAVLIIVFPVFLILSRAWLRMMRGELSHWDGIIRKWMLYLVLFLASMTAIVDLVTLVRYFVSGEITVRFILKVLAVLIVAGMVGWYYIREIRGTATSKIHWYLAIKSSVLVLAAIIWGFCVMGSPLSQRDLRLDQRRIDDLQSIQWQVISFWQQKERLPKTLDELANPISSYMVPTDPEFEDGRVYEYSTNGDKTFTLCATFTEPIPKGWVENGGGTYGFGGSMPMRDVAVSSYPAPGGIGENWDHEAGRTCFERTIDPDMYPPFPKPVKQ